MSGSGTPRVPMFMGAIFEKFGSKITVDEDKRTAKYSGSSNWQGSAICTPCDKFSYKVCIYI